MAAPRKRKAHRAAAGYVRKLPSGRYQASHVHEGKRYSIGTFDAKVDADAQLRRRLVAAETGEWSPEIVAQRAVAKRAAATTLAEYAETWLATNRNRKGEPLRPRTVAEYRRLLAGSLGDLAPLPLVKITPEVVDVWFDGQSRGGKLTQASRAYSLLSTILGHAVDRGGRGITSNPCRVRGAQSARTGKRVEPPTDAELAAIVAVIPAHFRALVYLAAEAGLRWGEATELRGSDLVIEADRVLVTVSRAVVKVNGEFVVGKTKTAAGLRSAYVFGDAAAAIAAHVAEDRFRFDPDALLFPASDGVSHLSQSTFHTPTWSNARAAAGRSDMPFHALRHYAGTRYVQNGATMAEAMKRLGHGSLKVAMGYQHATDRDAEIAARMAQRPTTA